MNRNIDVYDIETLKSCFTLTGINIDTGECNQFVIHKKRNDVRAMLTYLRSLKGGIGFNNLSFDYPVIHHFIDAIIFEDLDLDNPEVLVKYLYDTAQEIISVQDTSNKVFGFVQIKDSASYFKQLDLYKIWHFNNKARTQSLKGLEIAMNMPNVMDMPIGHEREDIDISEVESILEYNKNDVLATLEFYKKSIDKIELRKQLSAIYGINLMNANDVKIGETIFLELLAKEMNMNKWDLKKLRTYRSSINLNEVILPYINFKRSELAALLDKFKNTTVTQTRDGFKFDLVMAGNKYIYGQGGLHMCNESGVYESNDAYQILDIDVSSFYPNIAVNNKFKPEHLGEAFTKIYSDIYKERSQIPKSDPRNGAYKLMLNGSFGKAGDENSFLFDNKFLLSITVNGQLLLSMLLEKLLSIAGLEVLQANTDGITVRYHKYKKAIIEAFCSDWEKITNLKLEYQEYTKMIIADVNNYIAVKPDGKVKYKGRFEIEKEYHKDNSFKIVPIALSEYFVKGIPVEETIKNHKNIYDFCGRQKFTRESCGEIHYMSLGENLQNSIKIEKQQKNVRYFISNKGATFIKRYNSGDVECINKGYVITVFNRFIELPFDEYDIDYNFYIKECQKEIDTVVNKQLSLFDDGGLLQ